MNGVPNFIPAGQKDLTLYSETGKPYTVSVSDAGALQIKDETTGETAGVGGSGGGIPTAIWKEIDYDNALMGVAAAESLASPEFSPVNMTCDDAVKIIVSGKPLMVVVMDALSGYPGITIATNVRLDIANSCIVVLLGGTSVYWLFDNTITFESPEASE